MSRVVLVTLIHVSTRIQRTAVLLSSPGETLLAHASVTRAVVLAHGTFFVTVICALFALIDRLAVPARSFPSFVASAFVATGGIFASCKLVARDLLQAFVHI